jgi:DNA gyrase/topoisomerase IV subunit A
VLEAKKHPESAPEIIEALAERLAGLDTENERLRDEIILLQRRTPVTTDGDEVKALRRRVAMLQSLLDAEASAEPVMVLVSDRGELARLPLAQVGQLIREARPVLETQARLRLCSLQLARPQDELLLLTSQARGLRVSPSDVPLLMEEGEWPNAIGQSLSDGEWLSAAVTVTRPPRFWTAVTRRGYVQQLIRIGFDRDLAQGNQLLESPFRRDVPVALVNGDVGDLLVLTRWGKGIRFSQRVIAAEGSTALELEPDDEVVAALPLPSDAEVIIVTASGYAMRRDTSQISARSKPGGAGNSLIKAFDTLAVFPYEPEARLLYLTYSGKLVFVPASNIPLHHRVSKGTQMRDFGRDPAVAVALLPGATQT